MDFREGKASSRMQSSCWQGVRGILIEHSSERADYEWIDRGAFRLITLLGRVLISLACGCARGSVWARSREVIRSTYLMSSRAASIERFTYHNCRVIR